MTNAVSAPKRKPAGRNASPNAPTPDRALHQHAVVWFAAFFLVALWAFWPSYFSRISETTEPRFHTHGIAMTLWCLMLIAQAYLIRTSQRRLHRTLGYASYVLAPLVVAATINLIHYRMKGGGPLPEIGLFQMALMVNAAVVFAIIYVLAMIYRRQPLLHARYMVCTVFPLFTPITDRLIYAHWPSLTSLVPTLSNVPLVQIYGFALADLLLVGLIAWDWRAKRRVHAFAVAFGIIATYHASVLLLYRYELWRTFGDWFRGLPLS
jgi:hypothetical protein